MSNKKAEKAQQLVNLLQQLHAVLKASKPGETSGANTTQTKDTKTPGPARRSKRKVDEAAGSRVEESKRRLSEARLEKQRREQEYEKQKIKSKLNLKLNQMEIKYGELKIIIDDIKVFVGELNPEANLNIQSHEEQIAKEISEIKKKVAASIQQGETESRHKILQELENLRNLVALREEESRKKFEELRQAMEKASAEVDELLRK